MTAAAANGDASRPLGRALDVAATALNLVISPHQRGLLLDFIDLLQWWNAKYNLTAIRDPGAMLDLHVIDCLAAVAPFRRESADRSRKEVLDAGSGGGLPGVVLAVMEPDSRVTCVDSVGKKAAFIQQVAVSLRLQNLHSQHARVETLHGNSFDLITCRAFSSLADFVRLTDAAMASGGIWMAMKGKIPEQEMTMLPRGVKVFHVEPLKVPGPPSERCLIWLRKTDNVRSQ